MDPFVKLVLILFLLENVFGQHYNSHLVAPKFTAVPPKESFYITERDSSTNLKLVCASWPPNSYLSVIDSQMYMNNDEYSMIKQKYALLRGNKWEIGTASYDSVDSALQNFTSSVNSDVMISKATTNVMGMEINIMGNAFPHVSSKASTEMHCLSKTNLGGIISDPFIVTKATLGKFSPEVQSKLGVEEVKFLSNNIAFFDCHIPEQSYPKPIVRFKKNNMELLINEDKHLIVDSVNGSVVTLLIHRFEQPDQGIYECEIENPLTMEKVICPIKKKLILHEPTQMVVSGKRRYFTLEENDKKEMFVNEGQNITIFCVIESAPPPDTSTSPYNDAGKNSRYILKRKFGALTIINVQKSDETHFICSDRKLSYTIKLKVIPKLELIKAPNDQVVRKFDQSVKFDCETSDKRIIPEWYFNGLPIQSEQNASPLVISKVKRKHLGIYQCVAREIGPDGLTKQWISKSAILSHESEIIVRTPDELASLIPKNMTESTLPVPSITTHELTPTANVIEDHLFALIHWNSSQSRLESAIRQMKPLTKSLTAEETFSQVKFVLEMITQQNSGSWPTALNGLMGSKQMLWSEPMTIAGAIIKSSEDRSYSYVYLNDKILKAGSKYRFRIKTVLVENELELLPVSNWSNILSFGHISPVDPPEILTVKPMSNGRIYLEWAFNEQLNPSNGQMNEDQVMQMVTEKVASQDSGPSFTPDYFMILARPVKKPKSNGILSSFISPSPKEVEYGKYKSFEIRGADARTGTISGLDESTNYQVLMFAVNGEGENKVISQFSRPHYANLGNFDIMTGNKWDIFSNNKLMYIILASLAAFMLLVMLLLIIICCCRQKRSRKNRDTYPFNYKHPNDKKSMKFPHQMVDQIDSRLLNTNGTLMKNGKMTNGNAMMMNPMDNYAQHQQAAEEYAATIAQAQAMQQQQQAALLLGSSLHLAQSPQNGNLINSSQLPHHQSHQSLQMNSMLMNGGNMGGTRISTLGQNHNYHSGTLPVNQNRYLMRQSSLLSEQANNGPPPPLPPPGHQQHQQQQMMYMPMGSSTLNRQMHMNSTINNSHYGTPAVSNMHQNIGKNMDYGDLNSLRNNNSQMNNSQFDGMMNANQMSMMHNPQQQQGYFAGSQQHLAHSQQQMPTYGPGSMAMGSIIGGNPGQPRQFTNDGNESIYSYFTQQQQQQQMLANQHQQQMMGTPGSMHPQLNPLPEEMNGYTDDGQHYSDHNTLNNSITGSPAQANGHKHHKRRRRKQPSQTTGGQQQYGQQQNGHMSELNQGYGVDGTTYSSNSQLMNNDMSNGNYPPPPPPIISQSRQSPLPPPNQPPPPPPAFSQQPMSNTLNQRNHGNSQSPQNVLQNLPRIRDYSEYGIPKNILPN